MPTHEEAHTRIAHLIQELTHYAYQYYVLDAPSLTDGQYDRLFNELKELENQYPDLIFPDSPTQRVGGKIRDEFKKIRHRSPMQSLDNAFDPSVIRAFYERITEITGINSAEIMCEPKIDGLAISLIYENGYYTTASTRGDGKTGEDVTGNVRTIHSLPLKLNGNNSGIVEVRGEICMTREDFAKLNASREEVDKPLFANPRNAAAGSIRQLNPHITAERRLRVYLYHIENAERLGVHTQAGILEWLREKGLPTQGEERCCSNIDDILEYLNMWKQQKLLHPVNTDGVVLKLNSIEDRNKLGATSSAPRWAIAFKFPPEEKKTRILNIEVSVGRTGALTPTAILEPVQLSGTMVQRASLHNQDEINRKDIRIGDWVWVHKAGEIIPEVLRVDFQSRTGKEIPYTLPDICPVCGSKAIRFPDEVMVRCTNKSCPAQIKEDICHFAGRSGMNITGLGEKLAGQLVEKGLVKNLADIYLLHEDQLIQLDRMGKKSVHNIIQAIEQSKSSSLGSLINALGIRHVGAQMAAELAFHFGSMKTLMNASEEELSIIEGVGPVIAASIVAFSQEPHNQEMIRILQQSGVNMLQSSKKERKRSIFEGKKFIFTGELSNYSRDEASKYILENGGKVTGNVSKNTDYVVVGNAPGNKLEKARLLGIHILTESDFEHLIRLNSENTDRGTDI